MPPLSLARSVIGLRAADENKAGGGRSQRQAVLDGINPTEAAGLAYVLELAALGAMDLNRTAFASRCRLTAEAIRQRANLPPDAGRLPDDAGGLL